MSGLHNYVQNVHKAATFRNKERTRWNIIIMLGNRGHGQSYIFHCLSTFVPKKYRGHPQFKRDQRQYDHVIMTMLPSGSVYHQLAIIICCSEAAYHISSA